MRLKVLALVLMVFCASFAVCSAIVVTHFKASMPRNDFGDSVSLVGGGGGPIITPMGPIDTPGGPT